MSEAPNYRGFKSKIIIKSKFAIAVKMAIFGSSVMNMPSKDVYSKKIYCAVPEISGIEVSVLIIPIGYIG